MAVLCHWVLCPVAGKLKYPRKVDKGLSVRLGLSVRGMSVTSAWSVLVQSGQVKKHFLSCSRRDIMPSIKNIYNKYILNQKRNARYTVNDLFSASALVTAPYLFFPAISSVTVHKIYIFLYIVCIFT